jgi:S1-C subfamily serine protease
MIPAVISEEEGVPVGAYVLEVNQGSAASDAGVLPRDIITEFDGKSLAEMDLSQAMGSKKVGDRVRFKIWRDGETQNLEATLQLAE